MGSKAQQRRDQVLKILLYALGRAPGEFGLVPDGDGFVPMKELLKGLVEEDGWRFLRLSHIREVLIHDRGGLIEVRDGKIRATQRASHVGRFESIEPPKILYFGVRPKAWPHVAEKGLTPYSGPWVVLSRQPAMALRLGRRRDPDPVLLEIHSEQARSRGVPMCDGGNELVLAPYVPPEAISGPPIRKTDEEPVRKPVKPQPREDLPGSFFLNADRDLAGVAPKGRAPRGRRQLKDRSRDKRSRREIRKIKTGKS